MWLLRKLLSTLGAGGRAFVALVGITGITVAIANYAATQGAGTDFGSRVNSAVHYVQMLICDMNVAGVSGNCAAVAPGNTISASATAIAVGGTVTANVGTGTRPVSQSTTPWPVSMTSTTITGTVSANQASTPWPVSMTSTTITGTIAATQSGTWTVQPGNTANTTPWLVNVNNTLTALSIGANSASPVADPSTDPCQMLTNSSTTISIAAATAIQLIAASASNKNYICSVDVFSKAGVDISVIEGTGANCQTGTVGIIGTMSVTGISIAAQGGVVKGGAGRYVWRTNGTNVGTCIYAGSANPLTGFLKYVQAP